MRSLIVGKEQEDSANILEFILEALHLFRGDFTAVKKIDFLAAQMRTSTRLKLTTAFTTVERGSAMLYTLC